MKEALKILAGGADLDRGVAERALGAIMDGTATAAQIGAFLGMLAAKGETVEELVATVGALRARCVPVDVEGPLVDLCGTGGDGLGMFNVSTAASFVAAAAGARVAKHGNRASSGSVGAADVLEQMGVALELDAERASRAIDEIGIAFLFAPAFHPAVRNVAGPRRELGFRTVFNLAGPLANPARASRQVLGVFGSQWLEPFARAAKELGSEHVLVVHGSDGADEITPVGPTRGMELWRGQVRAVEIDPSDFGIARCAPAELHGGSVEVSADLLRGVLQGARGARSDAVAMNAGAAIYVAGLEGTLAAGVARAQHVLASGKAWRVFERYREHSACGAST